MLMTTFERFQKKIAHCPKLPRLSQVTPVDGTKSTKNTLKIIDVLKKSKNMFFCLPRPIFIFDQRIFGQKYFFVANKICFHELVSDLI